MPTPPDDAVVFRHLENSGGWNSCSGCAGGDNRADDFWMNGDRDSPSLDGSSREFFVGGPPWVAALFYKPLQEWTGQYSWATHFLWDFWVYVDEDSMHNVWDLEFDLYQAVDGYEYMIGTHCVFGSTWDGRNWEVYSQADHEWKGTDIPCSRDLMPPGKWNHVQWLLRRVPDTTKYRFETLIVNGDVYDVGIPQWAGRTDWQDTLGVQWQIDTGPNGGGAHEWLDKATLTIW